VRSNRRPHPEWAERGLNLDDEKIARLTAVADVFLLECKPMTYHEGGIAGAIEGATLSINRRAFRAGIERAKHMRVMGASEACKVGREVLKGYGFLD
jgi:hypothetical protein